MTKMLCAMFGHPRPKRGWWGDGLYGKVVVGSVDGIGRAHMSVTLECERCMARYVAARFHADADLLRALQPKDQPHDQ